MQPYSSGSPFVGGVTPTLPPLEVERLPAERDPVVAVPPGVRAVIYLRVSTRGQVNTDYDPEGISIPAQRLACERKAEQLGLTIVDEYADLGQSGTESTRRVSFNQMLDRIRRERDVDYVIVYKLSRFARNRIDDALTMVELQKRNVVLVSATEQIDNTAVGQLMHGILSSFNEFRSREDGADIAYKMEQKAKSGGTLGKAPLGYLNTIERIDGRDIRSVAVDEERATFVKLAFELFARGDRTMDSIARELSQRGLTTRPTQRRPAGPVSTSKISRLLRDRYYLGVVVYKGDVHPGRHEALISPELFDAVQRLLVDSEKAGERKRVHMHYLKGTVFCGVCRTTRSKNSRLLVQRTANRHGGEYLYYFCIDRQGSGVCRLSRHIEISDVEQIVLEHYSIIRFEQQFIDAVSASIDDAVKMEIAAKVQLRDHIAGKVARMSVQMKNLVDLVSEGGMAASIAKDKLASIEQQLQADQEHLGDIERELRARTSRIQEWLDLLSSPSKLYARADPPTRRSLNQALFRQIYLMDEDTTDQEFSASALHGDIGMSQ